MREIKFRAWDKEKEKMVIAAWRMSMNLNGNIYWKVDHYDGNFNLKEREETDGNNRFTLMQFTGLHNKNGQEIYEGDICKYSYINPMTREERTFVWKVEWSNGAYWLHSIDDSLQDTLLWIQHKEIEVIGNIYENPELLKKEAWSMK